jgi:hypothetical protein
MELIHMGQPVLDLGGRLDYFLRMALNYPRLAGYQGAALPRWMHTTNLL